MARVPVFGDHLVSWRRGYAHHGLYSGDGRVIHYAGNAKPGVPGPIEQVSLDQFKGDSTFHIKDYKIRKYTHQQSVERARSRLGEDGYCVFSNNCEHFVRWCIEGDHHSDQVMLGTNVASGTLSAAGGAAGVGAVAGMGAVAGLSGSGIMSGLATVGGAVGGGAVAGLATLAAAPGAAATLLVNNTLLKDNPALNQDERDSRLAGRVGTAVGAATATAGGIAAVSAMGTTAGLSAAGISSGLAAIVITHPL